MIASLAPEDSLPAGQPEPVWPEDMLEAPLPGGGGAEVTQIIMEAYFYFVVPPISPPMPQYPPYIPHHKPIAHYPPRPNGDSSF